jgi:tetratricopeptide (TPR) repeat protein
MRGIFVALSTAYGYSLDSDAFADKENRQQILGLLEALSDNAEALETHGGGLDPSFEYLRRSLARDADDALDRFKKGNYVGSRVVLSKITENCVTCHTRLPATREFDLGKEFLDEANVKGLPPEARVNLEIATRQFDKALGTYEAMLSSTDMTAADLARFDVFENYLKICIGALNDTERPVAALKTFTERGDMPKDLVQDVDGWLVALGEVDFERVKGEELTAGRTLIEEAANNTVSRSDRSQLVGFIAGITVLHRYLDSRPTDDVGIAGAYYLLGIAESYIARSYWISETPFLLEKAIRLAPKSDVARQAYAFLDHYTHSDQGVTPARPVTPDLETNLEELRKLIEE